MSMKVSQQKRITGFGKNNKMASRYIASLEIVEMIEPVDNKLIAFFY